MPEAFQNTLADSLHRGTLISLVLSKPRARGKENPDKITVRPVEIRGRSLFQITSHAAGRQTHENVDALEAAHRVEQFFGGTFEHAHLFTAEADYSARAKSPGAVVIKKSRPTKSMPETAHDRTKSYLIPENQPCPFLEEIGVMTSAGKVRAARYHKFRQINRFLELINDVLPHLPPEGPLHIVDFGCGKSYLTFALHHLLTTIHGREVDIVGLDQNASVIRDCSRIAAELGCRGLDFRVGDIAAHRAERKVDMAVSLHACDTATDSALAQAIAWQADVILAVPCCQHEFAQKLTREILRPIQQHGILRERFAALATDALRAQALELCGYRTQVIEFIDLEHTAKNILIRALRDSSRTDEDASRVAAYREFKAQLGLEDLHLEHALGKEFRQMVAGNPSAM